MEGRRRDAERLRERLSTTECTCCVCERVERERERQRACVPTSSNIPCCCLRSSIPVLCPSSRNSRGVQMKFQACHVVIPSGLLFCVRVTDVIVTDTDYVNILQRPGEIKSSEMELGCHSWMVCLKYCRVVPQQLLFGHSS